MRSRSTIVVLLYLMSSSEKLVKKSFRVSMRGYEGLEDIAKERDVSVNTVVREVVDQYVDYEYTCTKMKIQHVDVTFLRFLTDRIPKEKLVEFAKTYARTIEGSLDLNYKSPKPSFETLMKTIRIYCKYNSQKLVETTHESSKIAIIIHDAGLNYSEFLANYYKTLFETIDVKIGYSSDENAVVLKFPS